jgi:RNA polymerase sigma-70 factor (ECF subfamily)
LPGSLVERVMMRAPGMDAHAQAPGSRELDRATLARCKLRDPLAFRAFVVRYERPVFALLSRMMGPGVDVEDLAQETFLRAFEALSRFDLDGPARASTWLLTIATRLALDARKRRRHETRELDAGASVADAATPETERHRLEIGRAIARAADELPDDQRAAFVLAEFHHLGVHEIARVLDVPENTAKTRLFRAREKMRAALASWRNE